ncbi:MAG: universal stress protein [Gemmatimonadales bacterium]
MNLHHVLAAADESDAGRQAVRSAIDLAARARARVTVMRTVAVQALAVAAGATETYDLAGAEMESRSLQSLHQWVESDRRAQREPPPVELGVAFGVPGIEIGRSAEQREADLLVLGRKQRSQLARLLLGDTADAVARRSRIPCLFVPPESGPLRRMLVALDGSERGMVVLREASGFARSAGISLRVVTVETGPADEPADLASSLPVARSVGLRSRTQAFLTREAVPGAVPEVEVRRGAIVEQVVDAVRASGSDVLAIGYHRGGLPGILEAGNTARHLAHIAPCAVLTIPL